MPEPFHAPPGHYYSPIVDPDELRAHEAAVWHPGELPAGIDFRDRSHREFLNGPFAELVRDFDYPVERIEKPGSERFFVHNGQFEWLDARVLFVMLRSAKPKRLVEVGSGFSTLLMCDVNRRFLGSNMEIACIEPYPREFLTDPSLRIGRLIRQRVQDAPIEAFHRLEAGDVLFIDSSHVSKTGSDVNYLIFEVLPRLSPGVLVHVHDIFLPEEYPKEWVLEEGRSWNEQYVIRALLMYSAVFRVQFGCAYAFAKHRNAIAAAAHVARDRVWHGGSLWIEKIA